MSLLLVKLAGIKSSKLWLLAMITRMMSSRFLISRISLLRAPLVIYELLSMSSISKLVFIDLWESCPAVKDANRAGC